MHVMECATFVRRYAELVNINVRENRRVNQKWTNQRNWQCSSHKTKKPKCLDCFDFMKIIAKNIIHLVGFIFAYLSFRIVCVTRAFSMMLYITLLNLYFNLFKIRCAYLSVLLTIVASRNVNCGPNTISRYDSCIE